MHSRRCFWVLECNHLCPFPNALVKQALVSSFLLYGSGKWDTLQRSVSVLNRHGAKGIPPPQRHSSLRCDFNCLGQGSLLLTGDLEGHPYQGVCLFRQNAASADAAEPRGCWALRKAKVCLRGCLLTGAAGADVPE